jgi:hypothetical protein
VPWLLQWQLLTDGWAGGLRASWPTLGNVNTVIVEVRRGRDGKLYLAHPLTHAERNRARWASHNMVCRDGLSIRAAQRAMAEQLGIRRSIGSIVRDLRGWECPACPHLNGPVPER